MYAKIVDNKIIEKTAEDKNGEAGWKSIEDADIGKRLVYDTDTNSVRAATDAENSAERDRVVLQDAWFALRAVRNNHLRNTDEYAVNDRAAVTNMPEYREYLRDLPGTYNDTSILTQDEVMDFDAYVASL